MKILNKFSKVVLLITTFVVFFLPLYKAKAFEISTFKTNMNVFDFLNQEKEKISKNNSPFSDITVLINRTKQINFPLQISQTSLTTNTSSIQLNKPYKPKDNVIKILLKYKEIRIETESLLTKVILDSIYSEKDSGISLINSFGLNSVVSTGICSKPMSVTNPNPTIVKKILKEKSEQDIFSNLIEITYLKKESIPLIPITDTSTTQNPPTPPLLKKEDARTKPKSSVDIEFKLTILPVRFVYVNSRNEIVKIWNNVKESDTLYVLKFFKDDEQSEIDESVVLKRRYLEAMKRVNAFKQGIIFSKEKILVKENFAQRVKMEFSNTATGIEEIYTYI